MQAGRVGDHDGLRGHPLAAHRHRLGVNRGQVQGQTDILTRAHQTGADPELGDALTVGDHHLGQQALGVGRQKIGIEGDQGLAGPDPLAFRDPRGEPRALEGHRIQTDVHHDLDALGRGQGHGMAGTVQLRDGPVAGCDQEFAQGVDRQTVADHPLRKHRVRDLLQRENDAIQRRLEVDGGHRIGTPTRKIRRSH